MYICKSVYMRIRGLYVRKDWVLRKKLCDHFLDNELQAGGVCCKASSCMLVFTVELCGILV